MLTEKDYCDYETCVALKELGYSESFPLSKDYEVLGKDYDILLYEAQKWLREEKGIEVVVLSVCMIGAPYYFQVYTEDYIATDDNNYDSFEKALSEGIKEAVKILMEENNGNSL